MKVILAFNPLAGSYSKRRLERLAAEFEAIGHSICLVDSQYVAVTAKSRHADLVCVVGGDGTLRDVIVQIEGQHRLPVCIYPAGTINLVAREAGYPRDLARFVKRVATASSYRVHHYGLLNDKFFLACASVGPDSLAVADLSVALKQRIGRLAYLMSFIQLLWSWPRMDLRVSVNGHTDRCEAAFVLKGHFFAGPWTLASPANLTAPEFHVLLLPRARRRDYLQLVLFAVFGSFFEDKTWRRLVCTDVEIDAREHYPVQADGDIATNLPTRFTINAKPLRFA